MAAWPSDSFGIPTHLKEETRDCLQSALLPLHYCEPRQREGIPICLFHPFWRVALLTLVFAAVSLLAQEKPDSAAPKVQADATVKPAADPLDKEAHDEVPKRIFWIIPNFMTANDQPENQGPLTPNQKYNIAWHQFWDESAHFGNVLQAAIS